VVGDLQKVHFGLQPGYLFVQLLETLFQWVVPASLVETLSSDPQGIGFVEINVAQTQSQVVKTLGIKKTPVAEESNGPWLIRQNISPDEPLTDLRLTEFIAANPKLTKLTSKELPNTALLKDLRSLFHLPALSVLELSDASGLSDITVLGKLTGLTKLTLAGVRTKNLGPLSTLSHLTTLDLSGSGEVSDISPLRSLTALKGLTLTGCPKVSELKSLVDLRELTTLGCAGCIGITDVTPLKSLPKLTTLNLADCTELVDIAPLAQCAKLRQLDLRRCEKVRADDLQWLQNTCWIARYWPVNRHTRNPLKHIPGSVGPGLIGLLSRRRRRVAREETMPR